MQRNPGGRANLFIRIAIISVIVAYLGYFSRNDQIDDALIYARYIRNALNGLGLVFNPGEHVNALTSPFYSYLVLATAKLFHGDVLSAMAFVSSLFLFFACSLAEGLIPFAGLLLASTSYFYMLVGMESSTFLCLSLLLLTLLIYEKYDWLPTASILLLLTRFEGGALLLPLVVELFRRKRWPSAVSFLPAVLIAAMYLGLNHHWYGTWLPASAGAKFGQGRSQYWGRWPTSFYRTAYQLKPDFLPTLYVLVLVGLLAPLAIWREGKKSALNRVVLPFLMILLGFYTVFNIPGYKWYYAPFIAFAMVYACDAIPRGGSWRWLAVPVLMLSAFSAAGRFRPTPPSSLLRDYPGIASWLTTNAPQGVRLESGEIGTLGWFCEKCDVIDVLGLTEPKNADHFAHRDMTSWLREDQPDYIVVHYVDWSFEKIAKESPNYERVPIDFGKIVYVLRRKEPVSRP